MRRRQDDGFALLEVLLALTLLSVGLVGVFGVLRAGVDYVEDGDRLLQAQLLAQELLDSQDINDLVGAIEGESGDGALQWHVEAAPWKGLAPAEPAGTVNRPTVRPELLYVEARVAWKGRHRSGKVTLGRLVVTSTP